MGLLYLLLYYEDSDYHGMDFQENVVQNLGGRRDLPCLQIIQTSCEDHPALYLMGTSESFPRGKVAGQEAKPLSPPSAKKKTARCQISVPPNVFMVCTVTTLLLQSRHQALSQIQYFKQNLLKVKQYLNRQGQALRVPGGSGSQVSRQSAQKGGKVIRPTPWPPSSPGNIPGAPFC
jgi:hypothetical protein